MSNIILNYYEKSTLRFEKQNLKLSILTFLEKLDSPSRGGEKTSFAQIDANGDGNIHNKELRSWAKGKGGKYLH